MKWTEAMEERFEELSKRVEDERDNLSEFRKIEAEYLVLTKEERIEFAELANFLHR